MKLFKNKWLLLLLIQIFLVWVALINIHPDGYVRGGGDAVQVFNFDQFNSIAKYAWVNEGEGYSGNFFSYGITYSVLGLIAKIFTLNASYQSFLYYLFFFSLSFWSFYLGLNIYSKLSEIRFVHKVILSLSYTFSSFTLFTFDTGWAFSPYFYLYPLLPVYFASIHEFFTEQKLKLRTYSLLIPALISLLIGGQNLGFIIAAALFTFLFISVLLIFKQVILNKSFLQRLVIFSLFSFILLSPIILPQIGNLITVSDQLVSNDKAGFDNWIMWQSVPFSNLYFYLFSFDIYANQNSRIILLSIFYIILVLLALRTKTNNKLGIVFFTLLFFNFIFLNKGVGLVPPYITTLTFSNPILGALRSFDKTLIFTIYFSLMVIAASITKLKNARYYMITLLFISIVINRNLLLGNLLTYHSTAYKYNESYKTAKYAPIIKMPIDYYQFANSINSESINQKLFHIPYTVITSIGWMNLPKLKHIGVDPSVQLFDNPSVNMATFRAFTSQGKSWNYGAYWNKSSISSSNWIIDLSSFLNIRYIIYRKDTEPYIVKKTKDKIDHYRSNGLIKTVSSNPFFDVYKIDPSFFQPLVFAPSKIIKSSAKLSQLPLIVMNNAKGTNIIFSEQNENVPLGVFKDNQKTTISPPILEYKKINPTKYIVRVHNATDNFVIVLSESFHKEWIATSTSYTNDTAIMSNNFRKVRLPNRKDEWQASPKDIRAYIDQGVVSTLGDYREDKTIYTQWRNTYSKRVASDSYNVSYISKNIRGSIQNNNLPNLPRSLEEKKTINNHFTINGYANGWYIDVQNICRNIACNIKSNGRSFEILIEFRQQHVLEKTIVFFNSSLLTGIIVLSGLYLVGKSKYK